MQYSPVVDTENENTSHAWLIRLVGRAKNVLDVGCAQGYIGAILADRFGCTVSGIEVDDAAAEIARTAYQEVLVGDVEDLSLLDHLRHGPFDVILFGDVLEHLQRPERVLVASRALLNPDGYALISLPNVVTLRLRLRFLLGRFEYTDQGIMDRTHLRFFTLSSARKMIRSAGYAVDHFEFIVGPNFGRRLARLGITRRILPPSLLGTQFIFKARPVRD